jgi:hypothetical protein
MRGVRDSLAGNYKRCMPSSNDIPQLILQVNCSPAYAATQYYYSLYLDEQLTALNTKQPSKERPQLETTIPNATRSVLKNASSKSLRSSSGSTSCFSTQ